ncbi:hypothetical protein VB264_13400 [Arcicella aquatica]|uniref:Uncharacterized protein n=1 Tax=Arcicella aquatica TaxID=217141 RepID=A0ABU5QQV3_9BACT|nr:hypothetical protein [Arcicella aquatica]MEA5258786.1 hypothetical protein [Arcicella aquatica]
MKGVNYITNDKGVKTAVIIDMKLHKNRIEDLIDGLSAETKRNEQTISLREAIQQRRRK